MDSVENERIIQKKTRKFPPQHLSDSLGLGRPPPAAPAVGPRDSAQRCTTYYTRYSALQLSAESVQTLIIIITSFFKLIIPLMFKKIMSL